MSSELQFINVTPHDIQRARKSNRPLGNRNFSKWTWALSNLPAEERGAIDSLLFFVNEGQTVIRDFTAQGGPQLDDQTRMEFATDFREKTDGAFCGRFVSPEWATISESKKHFLVPGQFFFDYALGIDHAIRFGQPKTYEDLLVRASLLGGSILAAAVKIMGVSNPSYIVPAVKCGRALLIAQWLIDVRNHALKNDLWLAQEDFEATGCTIGNLRANEHSKPVTYLVRLYAHRLEQLFREASSLIPILDFDCSRVIRGLIGAAWKTVLKIQVSPELVFQENGPVSNRDQFAFKARYVLGLDEPLPFEIGSHETHKH